MSEELRIKLDYPEAARVVALYLAEFCDNELAYPDMIAGASVSAAAKIEQLKAHIDLHAGDCESLRTEVDMFRERCDEAEAQFAASQKQANDLTQALQGKG